MTLVQPDHDELERRSATALTLPEGLDFEAWAEIGRSLLAATEAVAWWVGDWMRYGERVYGAQYSAAIEGLGLRLEPGTLADYQWVAGHVAPDRRRSELSWRHHREVAALEPEAQIAWLNTAAEGGWSSRELAAAVRRDTDGPAPADPAPADLSTRPAVATSVKAGVELVVRGEATHVEMLRAATDAVESQLRDHAHDLAVRLRSHLADAGVSAVVEVR